MRLYGGGSVGSDDPEVGELSGMLAVLWWSFGEVEMVDSLAIVGFGYVVELEFVFVTTAIFRCRKTELLWF